MKLFRAYQKEIRQLHFSIFLALALTGYTLLIFAIDFVKAQLDPAIKTEFMWTAVNALVGWMAILLVVSYWRYNKVSVDSKELEKMIEGMNPDVVLVVNPAREIVMCNDAVERLFEYDPQEILKKKTEMLYRDRRSAPGQTMGIYEQLEKLGFHYGFATGIKKSGEEVPLEIITGNLRGRPGAVLQIKDATKLEHVQKTSSAKSEMVDELEESLKRLREAEMARDNLTQMVVHDMKTPLQIIMGNLELLESDVNQGNEVTVKTIDHALAQTRRLVDMVHSILEVSRLESGSMELKKIELDLNELLKQSISDIQGVDSSLEISTQFEMESAKVSADKDVLSRVITNLLSNALKHGEKNSIEVGVKNQSGFYRLYVKDSGPGISPENRHRIFEKFAKFGKDASSSTSTGLGLTFCKLAVEAHEGQIGVESQKEEGCIFWFDLPSI